jgi:hypothetical protein
VDLIGDVEAKTYVSEILWLSSKRAIEKGTPSQVVLYLVKGALLRHNSERMTWRLTLVRETLSNANTFDSTLRAVKVQHCFCGYAKVTNVHL